MAGIDIKALAEKRRKEKEAEGEACNLPERHLTDKADMETSQELFRREYMCDCSASKDPSNDPYDREIKVVKEPYDAIHIGYSCVTRATAKAILLTMEDGEDIWLPKGVCSNHRPADCTLWVWDKFVADNQHLRVYELAAEGE